jgi:hypothetical protein
VDTRASLERSVEEIRENRDLKLELIRRLQGPPDALAEDDLSRMIRESFYMQMQALTSEILGLIDGALAAD